VFADYLDAGFSSDNCCSYAISLAAARQGLQVDWLGTPFFRHLRVPLNKANQLGNLYRISDGQRRIIFNKTMPLDTPKEAINKAKDKFESAALLASYGVATTNPSAYDVSDPEHRKVLVKQAQFPLVVKPAKGSMGKQVFANIENKRELKQALSQLSGRVICERYIQGNEYRVYILGGRPVAAVRRHPPTIIGDGRHTIEQLVDRTNQQRRAQGLPIIKTDEATAMRLVKNRFKLTSKPRKGVTVVLSDKLGRSSGGLIERVELTELSRVYSFCERVKQAFPELDVLAIDVIDNGDELVAIELNTRPQISSLLNPDKGQPFDFAMAYVQHFFTGRVAPAIVEPPNARTLLQQLKQGIPRVAFATDRLIDQAPVIDEPDAALLHNQGNIHQLILQRAAWQRGYSVTTFTNSQGHKRWAVTNQGKTLRFRQNMPAVTSLKTRQLTNDKFETKRKLQAAGIATPAGGKFEARDTEAVLGWYRQLSDGTRVVVKPIGGAGGKGVTSNIQTIDELKAALTYAQSKWVVVEEHISGDDYRLICSAGRFLAAIHRLPASVTGDGKHTIQQLINLKNKARQANPYLKKCVIRYDEAMEYRLQKHGYDLKTILPSNDKLYLNDIANITAGGDSVDITDQVHDDFKRLAESAQLAFTDLAYCGVDILARDITAPMAEQPTAIIEINANCDVALHHFPSVGSPRDTAGEIISDLFNTTAHEPVAQFFRVRGKVTGVGYRKWAARRCAALGLTADIKNHGKSVEIRAQGSKSAIDKLHSELIKGPKNAVPTDVVCRILTMSPAND
jgi:D-alanine-D-alanine ligase-like ATP-grasp enzyme/acylphosphatase